MGAASVLFATLFLISICSSLDDLARSLFLGRHSHPVNLKVHLCSASVIIHLYLHICGFFDLLVALYA
jgi:hypothetical protein